MAGINGVIKSSQRRYSWLGHEPVFGCGLQAYDKPEGDKYLVKRSVESATRSRARNHVDTTHKEDAPDNLYARPT
jgi:hypothetical protein